METIVIALIFFSIIIMIHELGHFLVAKSLGIYAEEFSIGMGPRIFKKQGKETVFSLRALPIGGYVKFLGEDDRSDNPRAFGNAKVWKRMAVIGAGSFMNFLLAVLLLSILFAAFGIYQETPVVGSVFEGSAAEQGGLRQDDRILGIHDQDFSGMEDTEAVAAIRRTIQEAGAETMTVTVEREGTPRTLTLTPRLDRETGRYQLGFYFHSQALRLSIPNAIGFAVVQTGRIVVMMIMMLRDLILLGRGIGDVMGPVGIVGEIGRAAQAGIRQLLNLGIIITINLGIINLIPFPALDGGRLTLLIVEAVRSKPIDPKKEGYFHLMGFVLLMLLMLLVTFQDIFRR
jgi:regulator of sigma E protease